jgi:hypothetical protein
MIITDPVQWFNALGLIDVMSFFYTAHVSASVYNPFGQSICKVRMSKPEGFW